MKNARFLILAIASALFALAVGPMVPTHAATTFVVNSTINDNDANTADGICQTTVAGQCTLRAAIQQANTLAGSDTINFNIPAGSPGCVGATNPVCTILPQGVALPTISEALTINGYTQPGASQNTNPIESGSNAVLKIELNGMAAPASSPGLEINLTGQQSAVIRGLAINTFGTAGIYSETDNNVVAGNYIGTDVSGSTDKGNRQEGIQFFGSGNTVGGPAAGDRNVISGNNRNGIMLNGTSNVVQGNYIGTSASGAADLGNTGEGVSIGSDNNTVGGTTAAARNVISGNDADGVYVCCSAGNAIQGNYIGTSSSGTADLGNSFYGVFLDSFATGANTVGGTMGVTLGGPCTGACNVISGNDQSGVRITPGASGYVVAGNYIGTDVNGTADVGNTNDGVFVQGSNNTLGGTASGARNLISGNDLDGVSLANGASANTVQGNYIGTNVTGTVGLGNSGPGIDLSVSPNNNSIGGVSAGEGNTIAFNSGDGVSISSGTGNAIRGNSIRSNGSTSFTLGIDLLLNAFGGGNGVTPNDAGDGDSGSNNLQNFPVLTSAQTTGATTLVAGSLNSTASTSFNIDFYTNSACDASGNGEGATYIGTTTASTDGTGNVSFSANVGAAPTQVGQFVTATATRAALPLDTSEFSTCVTVSDLGIVVDTTSDAVLSSCNTAVAADCSLRGAITKANLDAAADVIGFGIPGCPAGVCTITPASALPTITQPVTIDGTTQAGALANTNSTSAGLNAALKIELNGTSAGAGVNGLTITAGNSTVRGLVINRFANHGTLLSTAGNNSVAGNYVGTSVAGDADLGNGVDGVHVLSGSGGNCIGGLIVTSVCTASPAARNLLSGNNNDGVKIESAPTPNLVKGNIMGLNAAGNADLGNTSSGVAILGSVNTIGGTAAADRNIISGNDLYGIYINAAGNNGVFGNYIGTDVTGNLDLGNTARGIITDGSTSGETIGSAGGGRNIISGNNGQAVWLSGASSENATLVNNYIGTNAAGTAAVGNSLAGVFVETGGNFIGSTTPGLGNLISGNTSNGVRITGFAADDNHVWGNMIGTAANSALPLKNTANGVLIDFQSDLNDIGLAPDGTGAGNIIAFNGANAVVVDGASAPPAVNNSIRGNSIHTNAGLGIDLLNGGNGLLAAPVLSSPGTGQTAAGSACAGCRVDVYSDNAEEGRAYHGSVVADGAGAWAFTGAVVGPNVTATATNPTGSTSEFSTPLACADGDADLMCDSGDPCPAVVDCDGDGWKDGSEANYVGTDPLDNCPDNTSDNAWPADINNDGFSDISDVSALTGVFGSAVPPAPARYNIAPDPPDGFVDISDVSRMVGFFGRGCAT